MKTCIALMLVIGLALAASLPLGNLLPGDVYFSQDGTPYQCTTAFLPYCWQPSGIPRLRPPAGYVLIARPEIKSAKRWLASSPTVFGLPEGEPVCTDGIAPDGWQRIWKARKDGYCYEADIQKPAN